MPESAAGPEGKCAGLICDCFPGGELRLGLSGNSHPQLILDIPRHFWAPGLLASWWAALGRRPSSGSHRPSSVTADAIGHRSVFVGSTPRGSVPTLRPGHEADPRGPVHGSQLLGTGRGQALRREQLVGPRGVRFACTSTEAETVADAVQCSVPSGPSVLEMRRPRRQVGGRQWTVASAPCGAFMKSSLTSS